MPTMVQKLYESLTETERTQVDNYIIFMVSRRSRHIVSPIPPPSSQIDQDQRCSSLRNLVGTISIDEASELETALSDFSQINPGDWV